MRFFDFRRDDGDFSSPAIFLTILNHNSSFNYAFRSWVELKARK